MAQMTDVMVQLWPRIDLNREKVNAYRIAFSSFNADQVIPVLRDFAANSEKYPSPAAIKNRLTGDRKGSGKVITIWDAFRKRHESHGTETWDDDQCKLIDAKWQFEGASRVYGHDSIWTVEYWRRWQCELHRQNMRESHPGYDLNLLRDEYESSGGMQEAKQIRDRELREYA